MGAMATLAALLLIQSVEENSIVKASLLVETNRLKEVATHLEEIVNNINSIRAFYATSKFVDRKGFHLFSSFILDSKHNLFLSLEWAPRVVVNDLKTLADTAHSDGLLDYRIYDLNAENLIVPAGHRAVYYPLLYAEPSDQGLSVLGFDHGSDPIRHQAMNRSINSGMPYIYHPQFYCLEPKRPQLLFFLHLCIKMASLFIQNNFDRHI